MMYLLSSFSFRSFFLSTVLFPPRGWWVEAGPWGQDCGLRTLMVLVQNVKLPTSASTAHSSSFRRKRVESGPVSRKWQEWLSTD